jgi:hypothetical protein
LSRIDQFLFHLPHRSTIVLEDYSKKNLMVSSVPTLLTADEERPEDEHTGIVNE